MDIDMDKLHKFSWVMVIIGLLLMTVGAPVFRSFLTSTQLVGVGSQTIKENSAVATRDAFAYPFSLGTDESIRVTLSVDKANMSVTVRFVTRSAYDLRYAQNGTATGLTGSNFLYTHPTIGVTPTGTSVATLSLTQNDFYIFEFGGDTSGTRIVTRPGNYVVLVYGTNSSNLVTNEDVMFNIGIDKSFPGRQVAYYLNWIGFGLIVGFLAIALLVIAKKTVEGRV